MIRRIACTCCLTIVAGASCGGKAAPYTGQDGETRVEVPAPMASGGATSSTNGHTASSAGPNAAGANSSPSSHAAVTPGGAVQATSDCASAPSPELFAQTTGITGIQIALTATDVYWNDGSSIMRQAKNGSSAVRVIDVDAGSSSVNVDDGHLYWWTSPNIFSTPLATPGVTQLLADNAVPVGWAVSEERVYYVASAVGTSGAGGGRAPPMRPRRSPA